MPRLADPDPPLPPAFSATEALHAGLTRDQVRQRVRSGAFVRVAKGRYVKASLVINAELNPYEVERNLHIARAAAAAHRYPGSVVAFESAALLHGLPLWTPIPRDVTLQVPPGRWTGRRARTVVRQAHVLGEHLILNGAPVTSPAVTWLDVARTNPLPQALTVGDAALRRGSLRSHDLIRCLEAGADLRGVRRAHAALAHLDRRRESPLESGSWAYFVAHQLPLPEMQVDVFDDRGFVGRIDFWWSSSRLVGECDGRMKYQTADDVYTEKRREDRLRALGLTVVRWGMADLMHVALATRLRRLLSAPQPAHRVITRDVI